MRAPGYCHERGGKANVAGGFSARLRHGFPIRPQPRLAAPDSLWRGAAGVARERHVDPESQGTPAARGRSFIPGFDLIAKLLHRINVCQTFVGSGDGRARHRAAATPYRAGRTGVHVRRRRRRPHPHWLRDRPGHPGRRAVRRPRQARPAGLAQRRSSGWGTSRGRPARLCARGRIPRAPCRPCCDRPSLWTE